GRQYSAGTETFQGPNGVNLGDADKVFGSVGLGEGTRVENSFKYVTPDLSGFKAILMYGTGDDGGNNSANGNPAASTTVGRNGNNSTSDRGSRVSIGALYANGPISVGASYDRQSVTAGASSVTYYDASGKKTFVTAGSERSALTNWQISGAYDFEVVKLALAY